MTEPLVLLHQEGCVATLTMNRPDKCNALSSDLIEELTHSVEILSSEDETRVIIIKGSGRLFSAGLDLAEAFDPATSETLPLLGALLFRTLYSCPKVTIAAIHGAALAGALGIVACCDIAIAEASATFSFPEVRRGLIPAQITAILARQVPIRPLRPWLLSGSTFDSHQALKLGILHEVAAPNTLDATVHTLVSDLLTCGPQAMFATKQLLSNLADAYEKQKEAFDAYINVRHSPEAQEGIAAYLEKRPPSWTVRR